MKSRLMFVIGAGVGYVLGTRAGREKYEQLAAKVEELWQHPTVQQGVAGGQEAIATVVNEHVPDLAKKAAFAARDALGLELPKK